MKPTRDLNVTLSSVCWLFSVEGSPESAMLLSRVVKDRGGCAMVGKENGKVMNQIKKSIKLN